MQSSSRGANSMVSGVHLYSWGYAGFDGRRLLGRDTGRWSYRFLIDSSDIRAQVIELCLSVDTVVLLIDELNDFDLSATSLYVGTNGPSVQLALWIVTEVDIFIAWYLATGQHASFILQWGIRRRVSSLQRDVIQARDMLQIMRSRESWLRRQVSSSSSSTTHSDHPPHRRAQDHPHHPAVPRHGDRRGPSVYVTQVFGTGNAGANTEIVLDENS